jgi:diguanylate cyclase (GGDEF)-like protein/PAS domain S-box-containing protein
MPRTILLVDEDKQELRALRNLLQQEGYDTMDADNGAECLRLLTEHEVQVVVADKDLADMSGEALLERVRETHPEAVLLLIDQLSFKESASGVSAFRYLPRPWTDEAILNRVQEAFYFHELIRKNSQLSRILSDPAEAVVITDARWDIQSVNPAFSRLTGFGTKELIGRDVKEITAGRDATLFEREIHPELVRTGQWHGELQQRDKDGIETPQAVSIHAVKNGKNEIFLLVFSFFGSGRKAAAEKVKRSEERIYFDRLTGLPNRLLFIDRLAMALAQAKRNKNMVGVFLLDLDRFKIINDTLGYKVGDEVLREVSERLSAHTRREDTVARLGGDEFILLMPRLARIEDAVTFNRKLLDVFKTPFVANGNDLNVSPSIGISIYPDNGTRAVTLIRNADTALGWSKEQGGNCYSFYTPTMQATAFKRLTMVNNLHLALEKNQFILYFQPQIDLATGRIIGAEALVRWQNPELGMITPSQFIPLAEESGLIVPIGAWTLHSACLHGRSWYEQGHTDLRIAVNLSARLFSQEDLVGMIEEMLAETGMPPSCLDLEITESILMQNAAAATSILDRLKEKGIQISMDDFGTGYSSLSYLKRFPIDALKIDQSFVRDVTTNPDDAAIVTAIIAMARSLKLRVIAEGVETEEQAAFLLNLGCQDIQGFLISQPVRAAEFERLIVAQKNRGQLSIPMHP